MLLLCIGPLLPNLDWILMKFFHQPKLPFGKEGNHPERTLTGMADDISILTESGIGMYKYSEILWRVSILTFFFCSFQELDIRKVE